MKLNIPSLAAAWSFFWTSAKGHTIRSHWKTYRQRLRHRRAARHRLLRQRKESRARQPLSGQWTDRLFRSSIALLPIWAVPPLWKMLFPLAVLLGLLAYMPALAKGIAPPDPSPSDTTTALHIGDQVPDIALHHLLNYKDGTAHLSDFRGKLVILDFWATWCSPCVAMMPKMDSLQGQFAGKVQFISVAYEKEGAIRAFFKKRPELISPAIPCVTEDQKLNAIFVHRTIPHFVAIGPKGRYLYPLTAFGLTGENIRKLLRGAQPDIAPKIDLDPAQPLIPSMLAAQNQLWHYALLVRGRIEGMGSGSSSQHPSPGLYGRLFSNQSLKDLYGIAAGHLIPGFDARRVILEIPDSMRTLFSPSHDPEVFGANCWSYDQIVPLTAKKDFYRDMLDGLNRFGPFKGTIEERTVDSYVLERLGQQLAGDTAPAAGPSPLTSQLKALPFMNGPVMVGALPNDGAAMAGPLPKTFAELQQRLREQGWQIRPVKTSVKMLVITPKL